MKARWLRLLEAVPYTMDGCGGTPINAKMLPDKGGRVGESYAVMALGQKKVNELIAAGVLEVLPGSYEARPQANPFYLYKWPDESYQA